MDTSPKGQVRLSLIIFAASVAITAFFSVPSWLPVFGIELEWFGNVLVVTTQRFLPLAAVMLGFIVGWVARGWQKTGPRATKRQQRKAESEYVDMLKSLPAPTKGLLRQFVEEGEVWGNIRDPKFKQLYQLGVIEGPSQFEILQGDMFVLKSEANAFLSENAYIVFDGLPEPTSRRP